MVVAGAYPAVGFVGLLTKRTLHRDLSAYAIAMLHADTAQISLRLACAFTTTKHSPEKRRLLVSASHVWTRVTLAGLESQGQEPLNHATRVQRLTSEIIYRLWKITRVFAGIPLFKKAPESACKL